jgi:hypothetical protein
MWVGLVTDPAGMAGWHEDNRHTVMDLSGQLVCIGRDNREDPNPLT